jgi:hypothetical protein
MAYGIEPVSKASMEHEKWRYEAAKGTGYRQGKCGVSTP